MEELLLLKNEYGIREVDFYDDTFTFYRDKIVEMCDLLISNKMRITWSCLTRPDFIDEKLLKHMKRAGCHQVMYGVESGSSNVLKALNRKMNVDFKSLFDLTRSNGVQIRATYMIGNYTETYKDVLSTIKYAKHLNSDYAVFNVCTPYPGTRLYKKLDTEGRITTKDWGKYDFFNVVFSHPSMSTEQITDLYKRANKEFYLRPIMFVRQLRNLLSFTRIKMVCKIVLGLARGVMNWR